jgi:hypothetical protein
MRLLAEVIRPVVLLASLGWLAAAASVAPQAKAKLVYDKDVLPILSDKCFKCHGPDGSARQANLRLDQPESAFGDRNGRWPIVPGKPKSSLVVQRILSTDDPMPPLSSGKTLTEQEKRTLTEWIKEGAKYGKLWSFEPLPAAVPTPKLGSGWVKTDLDRFVLAQMESAGLKPSRPADRTRLLRRVTIDLTGLPPTPSEIAGYVSDARPGAYERVVERLLQSPHFGERMAVDWLDAARYADSYGYQSDLLMPTWPYRDWVVRAFNQNLPYDRFLTDQLAGDLLPNPTQDEILATAFNRLHRQSNEGGSIAEEFKTEYAVDRVSTFGTAMLGLTLGCARCHDHKFDPISQREFYQLYAYFNSLHEYGLLLSTEIVPTPSLLLPTPAQKAKLALLVSEDRAAKAARATSRAELPDQVSSALQARFDFVGRAGKGFANLAPGSVTSEPIGGPKLISAPGGKGLEFDGDNGLVIRGLAAKERWDPFTWSFALRDPGTNKGPVVVLHRTGGTDVGFCGFDLLLEDGRLTARVMRHWPGDAVAIRTVKAIPRNAWTHVGWSWDGSGEAAGLKLYVDGRPAQTEVVADKLWKTIHAYGDLGPSGGEWSFAQRFRDAGFKGGQIAEVACADRAMSPFEIRALAEPGVRPEGAERTVFADAAEARVRATQRALATFEDGIQEISVMADSRPTEPAYLLFRGRYDAPKNAATLVHRGVPKSLPPLGAIGSNNRLALARWLTSPNHPLTARVAVNRFWQMLFGRGLVETSENFGVQGSRPANQALLDFLARRFVDSGWNVKALVREMVLSATYRQDSVRSSKKDPENRFLARGPSQRLTAEMIRDTVLAAAGLISLKVGGPPVNPYQPGNLWQENNGMSPPFVQSKGADLYRRSLYSTVKRTTRVPSMLTFDSTSREACTVRRPATNTPLQALVLLNDVQYVEAARVLAEKVLGRPDPVGQVREAFVRLAGRRPDAFETQVLLRTLREQGETFRKDPKSAARLIAIGDSKADTRLDPVALAAMTVTVQTILNSDAVIWKR